MYAAPPQHQASWADQTSVRCSPWGGLFLTFRNNVSLFFFFRPLKFVFDKMWEVSRGLNTSANHQSLLFTVCELVADCVSKSTLPRNTYLSASSAVHVLCTHPRYGRSWPHCLANLGARSVCVLTLAHYASNPRSLASSLPVWGGSGVALACQPEPCIIFKEVSPPPNLPNTASVSFQWHGSPALVCGGSPWYARHVWPDSCVLKGQLLRLKGIDIDFFRRVEFCSCRSVFMKLK